MTVPDMPKVEDNLAPIPCFAYRTRTKNVFTGPREVRGLHEFRIHCVHEFAHDGYHTDPTGRTW